MKELICICCPKGCHLHVDEEKDYAVTGNSCPQGAEYGRTECIAPTRVVTSTVVLADGVYPRCPVKTAAPIPKGKIFAVMQAIDNVRLTAPVTIGQIVLANAAETGINIVATRTIPKGAEK